MLVLTRRSGESIIIGNDIVVTILDVRNDQVRVGIQAPRSIQVHREEVFQQISRENTAAVSSAERAKTMLRRLPPGALPRPKPSSDAQQGNAGASAQAPPSKRTGETAGPDPQPPRS